MSQRMMGLLFDVESNTITYHLGEIYKPGELEQNSTTQKIRVVQQEGNRNVNREIDHYNLDATSMDYDKNAPMTKLFFAKIQNQLHYAVSHQTAAEIIYTRADSTKNHMGLSTWKNHRMERF